MVKIFQISPLVQCISNDEVYNLIGSAVFARPIPYSPYISLFRNVPLQKNLLLALGNLDSGPHLIHHSLYPPDPSLQTTRRSSYIVEDTLKRSVYLYFSCNLPYVGLISSSILLFEYYFSTSLTRHYIVRIHQEKTRVYGRVVRVILGSAVLIQ